jgi:hypothetical protein
MSPSATAGVLPLLCGIREFPEYVTNIFLQKDARVPTMLLGAARRRAGLGSLSKKTSILPAINLAGGMYVCTSARR